MKQDEIKEYVRERYGALARSDGSCCSPSYAAKLYRQEAEPLPRGIPSLGCGNPVAIAELKEGEVVLDLGSGAGLDCFLAARRVGEKGKVIGLDMTPEMLEKARENAERVGATNVEFRLGEMEAIPLEDASVDVVISNCVINLSPDKDAVFREAFRVLRPGGRMSISDIVWLGEPPPALRRSLELWAGCIAGALEKEDYLKKIKAAGFDIKETSLKEFLPGKPRNIASLTLKAVKP